MYKKSLALFFLIMFLPAVVSAQSLFDRWYEYLHIPREFSEMPELLYFVFLPFVSTFAVIFGLLGTLFKRTFPRKVNVILAFVFAFSLLYLGPLMALVGILFQVGSIFAVIIFFVMFVVLILLLFYRRTGESFVEATKIYEQYKDVAKQSKRLAKDLENIGKDLTDIQKKIDKKKNDLRGVQELYKRLQGISGMSSNIFEPVKKETKRLTGSTPTNTAHAKGLLVATGGQLMKEIGDLEDKRNKFEKNQRDIENKLRA